MTGQPEPTGGVWQDRNGNAWLKDEDDGFWTDGTLCHLWGDVRYEYGPLVPLVPDPGWQSDGEPVVCRVVRDGEGLRLLTPTGKYLTSGNGSLFDMLGLPVPPEPEPSLADRQMTTPDDALIKWFRLAADYERARLDTDITEQTELALRRVTDFLEQPAQAYDPAARLRELENEATGAERYLADRLNDPEYRRAYEDGRAES